MVFTILIIVGMQGLMLEITPMGIYIYIYIYIKLHESSACCYNSIPGISLKIRIMDTLSLLLKFHVFHNIQIVVCVCILSLTRKWTQWDKFKSWTRLIAFHIALIPLGKVWIQLFSLQLWVNSRADWVLRPWLGN